MKHIPSPKAISLLLVRFPAITVLVMLVSCSAPASPRGMGVHPVYGAIRSGNDALLAAELSKDKGAVSLVSATDGTPLCLAARLGRMSAAKTLLANGAAVDGADPQGATALFFAVEAGNRDMVELLLDHGATVHARLKAPGRTGFSGGVTPFVAAVTFNHWNVVEPLVRHGADVNWEYTGRDLQGTRATLPVIHYAAMYGGRQVVELMLAKSARFEHTAVLISAVNGGDIGIVKLFMQKGAGVNEKGPNGNTALHAAVHRGRKDLVELLLAHGADKNARMTDGTTPLMVANKIGRADMAAIMRGQPPR